MRGEDGLQESLFTFAKLEDFVPAEHPLRPIRLLVNEALARRPARPQLNHLGGHVAWPAASVQAKPLP